MYTMFVSSNQSKTWMACAELPDFMSISAMAPSIQVGRVWVALVCFSAIFGAVQSRRLHQTQLEPPDVNPLDDYTISDSGTESSNAQGLTTVKKQQDISGARNPEAGHATIVSQVPSSGSKPSVVAHADILNLALPSAAPRVPAKAAAVKKATFTASVGMVGHGRYVHMAATHPTLLPNTHFVV
jgi:hypothetical protein